MKDQFGRNIDYLRLSLTDRCNLRCVYCMPEEGILQTSHEEILRFHEIIRICTVMADLGIEKIKLTGGEPLVRKNCADLIRSLKEIPGIRQVTLTTNGVLLEEQMAELAAAGLDGINISLDTTDPEEFAKITRRDDFEKVMRGIRAAMHYPNILLKINSVAISSEDENYVRLARFAKDAPVHVRFIEIMPIGYGKKYHFRSEDSVVQALEKEYGVLHPVEERLGNGPCHYYSINDFQGKIGFISAMTHRFCDQCNRIRLTSEGYLKLCLQYEKGADLKNVLRNGASDEELAKTILAAMEQKPIGHRFLEEQRLGIEEKKTLIMSKIGG
ncbi:MAG: GTP 3',8-cyclase MoaA [Blautia sp.]|nr:GTP 3',8-cyclase MoaA [Blautia sp.]